MNTSLQREDILRLLQRITATKDKKKGKGGGGGGGRMLSRRGWVRYVLDEEAVGRKRSFLVIPSAKMWYRNSLLASWQNWAVKRDPLESAGWDSFIPIIVLLSIYPRFTSLRDRIYARLLAVKFEFLWIAIKHPTYENFYISINFDRTLVELIISVNALKRVILNVLYL